MLPGHKNGAISEMVVTVDLVCKGFNVYRAATPTAPWDLIASFGDDLIRVEVRSVMKRKDGTLSPSVRETDKCDVYAFVHGQEITYMTPEEAVSDFRHKVQVAEWRRG